MSQFDVYENNNPNSKEIIPYLLDVQHELHTDLSTRIVIPLVIGIPKREQIPRLCPSFVINGEEVNLSAPEIGAYPKNDLGKKVESLAEHRSEIMAAIDFLISGF